MTVAQLIRPHGGVLVDRVLDGERAQRLRDEAVHYPAVRLDDRAQSDLLMLVTGAFSPLEGFMSRDDYRACVQNMRLQGGTVWPLPVTLPVEEEAAELLAVGSPVSLVDGAGSPVGILELREKYYSEKSREARLVYGTVDAEHPGVRALLRRGAVYLTGSVWAFDDFVQRAAQLLAANTGMPVLSPRQTRREFARRGWGSVVAFQTRNPLHRVHEHIQKCALELVDGLLLHPLVGATKHDDVPADVRVRSYRAVLDNYFSADRVVLSGFPAFMRYGGPREAIFHALVRKNYGCSHFIVGRDHAGVGGYYDPVAAHHIFDDFGPGELGVTPLRFDPMFYCRRCGSVASDKTCPHGPEDRVQLSGTAIRELLSSGTPPPPEVTRPEVAEVLMAAYPNAPEKASRP